MIDSQLRPMGFGETLDAAFSLYRRNFGTLFLTALLPNLPIAAYWLFLSPMTMSGSPEQMSALTGVGTLLLMPYSLIATMLVWGALVHDSSRAINGEPVSLGAGFRRALRRFFPLLGVTIAAGFVIGLGFLLFILPGILLSIMFFAGYPTAVIEGKGPIASLSRSRELARDGWGRIFGIMFIAWLIVALPSGALAGGIGFLAALDPQAAISMSGGLLPAAMNAGSIVIGALTTPYMVACVVLLYYDRRVRKDALDLEVATERINPAV